MPTYTHYSVKGPIGVRQDVDPMPGEKIGPMNLPATYRKSPYIPDWAKARRKPWVPK